MREDQPRPYNCARRRERQAQTRKAIIDAAKVMFAGGYEAATIRTIAAAAGVSTGAIFANWKDKAHLYREIHGHGPVSPEIGAGALDVLRKALAGTFDRERAAGLLAQYEGA